MAAGGGPTRTAGPRGPSSSPARSAPARAPASRPPPGSRPVTTMAVRGATRARCSCSGTRRASRRPRWSSASTPSRSSRSHVARAAGRPGVARRARRHRRRGRPRRVRRPRPPPRCGAAAAASRPAAAGPPVQQLRHAGRRPPRHEGLRRLPPGLAVAAADREPSELLVLDPDVPRRSSTAWCCPSRRSPGCRPTATPSTSSATPASWWSRGTGSASRSSADRTVRYRTMEGQGYGWDCVIAGGSAWFLDDGEGSEGYTGTLRGHGVATAPLHLVRIDLASGDLALAEVCGLPGGLVANPPVVDVEAGIAVGYDSATACWSASTPPPSSRGGAASRTTAATCSCTGVRGARHRRPRRRGRARRRHGGRAGPRRHGQRHAVGPLPVPGWDRDLYLCSFLSVTRVAVVGA